VSLGRGAARRAAVLACIAATASAQVEVSPQEFAARMEVIARTIAFDVVDSGGKPVDQVTVDMITVSEDGVERRVLEVRPYALIQVTGGTAPAAATAAPARPLGPTVVRSRVVVALDPVTLGPRDWREATEELSRAADSLVALGPVDVVALSAPVHRAASGTRDPEAVRAALAEVQEQVPPFDAFYRGRTRLLRDAQERRGVFQDIGGGAGATLGVGRGAAGMMAGTAAAQVATLRGAAHELAADEERLLRDSLDRLGGVLAALPRPSILVWVAGGDPMPGEFFARLLPSNMNPGDVATIADAGQSTSFWNRLDELWEAWAEEGVRVVAWSPSRVRWTEIGSAETRGLLQNDRPVRMAEQELALFQGAAEKTGGALALTGKELPRALASVAGRFLLTYQTDSAAPGWRSLRLEVARRGWKVRYPERILVPEEKRQGVHPVLSVELTATREASDQPGRERVTLPVVVDLAPLRERLGLEAAVRLIVKVTAIPPHGRAVAREVEVALPRLPAEGSLRYETSLIVPTGTSGYAVEVREPTTGAVGTAGPVEAVSGDWVTTPPPPAQPPPVGPPARE
jgi:hypothetical protein